MNYSPLFLIGMKNNSYLCIPEVKQKPKKKKMKEESVYEANGYKDRKDYLEQLADMNGVNLDSVLMLADILGPNEDFDGLVTSIGDMGDEFDDMDDYFGEF